MNQLQDIFKYDNKMQTSHMSEILMFISLPCYLLGLLYTSSYLTYARHAHIYKDIFKYDD